MRNERIDSVRCSEAKVKNKFLLKKTIAAVIVMNAVNRSTNFTNKRKSFSD